MKVFLTVITVLLFGFGLLIGAVSKSAIHEIECALVLFMAMTGFSAVCILDKLEKIEAKLK